ncbi:CKLF-like MARVEL transmembrane domain-containing protein 6 [Candoia aspera]|uniref:CKLF-like MARVEL transmembrane domain-containing protein 6 n=1 Tax=Candoia aspera TaxID=51853 RepID=UPI002FD7ED8C
MENTGQVYEDTTVPTEQSKGPCWGHLTTSHLGRWRLCLKISQLVLSFIAFVLEEIVTNCSSCAGLYIFEFVSCSAFLLSISILVVYCSSLYEKTGKEKVACLDFIVVLLVGSIFLLASITFSGTSDKTPIENAAIAFGFFASIAFLVDGVQMIKKRWVRNERQLESTTNPSNPPENQPLNNQQA